MLRGRRHLLTAMWQDRAYASRDFGSYVTRARATWWIIGITVSAHVVRKLVEGNLPGWKNEVLDFAECTRDAWGSFELWRPFTYMLVHDGISHLLWNMLFLGVAGTMLEPQIGSRALVRLYVISGLAGSLSPIVHGFPTIGASGAISGVMVALAIWMPNVVVLFMFLIPMKIKWVVAVLIGIDVLNLLSRDKIVTDSLCHVLGAFSGFSIAFLGPRIVTPWVSRRRAERACTQRRAREVKEIAEEQELDRLLEKISREGIGALTDAERRFLKDVSGKYQNTRRD